MRTKYVYVYVCTYARVYTHTPLVTLTLLYKIDAVS